MEPKRELVAVELVGAKAEIGTLRDFGHFTITMGGGTITATEDDGSKVELEWSNYITGTGFDVSHASGLRASVDIGPIIKEAARVLLEQVAKRAAGEFPPLV